ncbi:MAG: long-chain fatty acid--CoA ligase [Minwuiales bacterium]|nr:long-chain fatty acid--CoA ligase [Minwuiales bacterium]
MSVPVYDWIAHHARRTPAKLAAIDLHSGRRFTYAEMESRVARLAGYLGQGLGVGRGDRVGVLAANNTDMFEMQFACTRIGAVFLPLNWRLTVPELEFIVGDAGPSVLICDADFAEAGAELKSRCGIPHLVDVRGDGGDSAYERGIAGAEPVAGIVPLTHDDLSTIMYTSGTTGLPKGAMITHGMTFFNAVNLGIPMMIGPRTVQLTVLPLFHTGGLNCYSNPVFHGGGTVLVMRAFDPKEALRLIGDPDLAITHFFGVPANYQFMAQQPEFDDTDLSRLQAAGIGGAPSPAALLETWAARGIALQQGYGMTETSPTVTVLDAEFAVEKVGSAGKPALHAEVKLVREDGSEAGPGEVGELWARGPNITPGYWNRPDATAESITDGWLHTGDAATMDEDGFYYIVDRWKDMYISGGENVYPAEVENVIYQLPDIAEAAVLGLPDEKWGEVGCVVAVLKPGGELTEREIIAHCGERLARFKQPRSVVFVEALPRNATGKVLKRELKDWLIEEADAAE